MIRWLIEVGQRLQAPYVAHLEAEIEWYRTQLVFERNRANVAVDRLLQMRPGVLPVTPMVREVPDSPAEVSEALLAQAFGREFNLVGDEVP